MEALSMSVKSFLRRLSRLLFVTNPAAFWLLLREGKEMAISYLYQVWTIYLWRKSLCMRGVVPCLLPEGTVSEMFPDVDLTQVTLLFPLPRPGGVQMHELALLAVFERAAGDDAPWCPSHHPLRFLAHRTNAPCLHIHRNHGWFSEHNAFALHVDKSVRCA